MQKMATDNPHHPPVIAEFLQQESYSAHARRVAVADNCRFDQHVSAERWDDFFGYLPDENDIATGAGKGEIGGDWGSTSKQYTETHVQVLSYAIPDTFLQKNAPASLGAAIEGNQTLVRIESLNSPLSKSGSTFEELQKAIAAGNTDFLEAFCAKNPSQLQQLNQFSARYTTLISETLPAEQIALDILQATAT